MKRIAASVNVPPLSLASGGGGGGGGGASPLVAYVRAAMSRVGQPLLMKVVLATVRANKNGRDADAARKDAEALRKEVEDLKARLRDATTGGSDEGDDVVEVELPVKNAKPAAVKVSGVAGGGERGFVWPRVWDAVRVQCVASCCVVSCRTFLFCCVRGIVTLYWWYAATPCVSCNGRSGGGFDGL